MKEKEQLNPYKAIGGFETIDKLVEAFYKRVARHPDLYPIFPEDLTETARKQKQFLTQLLGGPPLYLEEHGHPMLRARHMRFPITPTRASAWLSCMSAAMDEIRLEEPWREAIFNRLTVIAQNMMNQREEHSTKGE
ncbi:MAG TPA: globin [Bacillales bacterium]|nr:globin [Bacillales bacterium]